MRQPGRLFLLAGATALLSGCMGYSGLVNSLAPEERKSELRTEIPAQVPMQCKSAGKAPFCAGRELYMVMPEADGKSGTVVVTFGDGKEVVLHGAYSALSLAGGEKKSYISNQSEMQSVFGDAISALPKAPHVAMLYFELGKDELTTQSKADAEAIYRDVVERAVPEVIIIGHTDTMGSEADNEALSIRRAERVRKELIERGVPADTIRVMGRGERNLLVETPDNTKEPKNRRVEINVR